MNEVGTSQVKRKDEWRVLHGWEEKMSEGCSMGGKKR